MTSIAIWRPAPLRRVPKTGFFVRLVCRSFCGLEGGRQLVAKPTDQTSRVKKSSPLISPASVNPRRLASASDLTFSGLVSRLATVCSVSRFQVQKG